LDFKDAPDDASFRADVREFLRTDLPDDMPNE
jgi:hypothetical protein